MPNELFSKLNTQLHTLQEYIKEVNRLYAKLQVQIDATKEQIKKVNV